MHQNGPRMSADSDQAEPAVSRILIVAPQPFFSERGTPIAILHVIRALRELSYEVDVLTYPIGRDLDLPGVRIFRCPNPFRLRNVDIGFSLPKLMLDVILAGSLFRILRRQRYQCIHAVEEAAFPAVIFSRHHRLPLVYDMQSSLPEQMRSMAFFRLSPIQAALRSAERWLLRRANVIACSLGLQSYVQSIHAKARVQEWWFPGQQFPVYAHQVSRIREEFGLTNGTRVVLYCGTFEPYQGLDELIKAAPKVLEHEPNTIFLLVGDNIDNPLTLTPEGGRLKEAGRLHIVPRQPSEMIASFYDVADVVVSPRANGSNIPLKIFDYMAAGRPIVATDIPPHREVLNAERAELVAATADAMAAGITRLLADRDAARRLGEAARSFSDEHLGWARFSESVATIYGMALETPPRNEKD